MLTFAQSPDTLFTVALSPFSRATLLADVESELYRRAEPLFTFAEVASAPVGSSVAASSRHRILSIYFMVFLLVCDFTSPILYWRMMAFM